MTGIRILADDLTGALDTAAAFSGRVPVYIDCPPDTPGAGIDSPVSVVATATRDVPVEAMPALLSPVVGWFTSGSLSFKKVDSLLRGNTFDEVAWLYRQGRFGKAIFAPAFPAQGRVTLNDRQWVVRPGGVREAVASPLRAAFEKSGLQAGPQRDERVAVWIPEVVTDDDLDRVVLQGASNDASVMWIGSAGLGNALARRFGLSPQPGNASALDVGVGPTVLVSASFQPVFREQWTLLGSARAVRGVAEAGDAAQIDEAIGRARAGDKEVWFDLSPRETVSPAQATSLLKTNTEMLVAQLPKPGQLVVVGGDTLLGLCRASGAAGLLAHPSIRPGWGCARLMGGAWDGVPCYSRSGAFGTADDLVALYGALRHTTSC